MTAADLAAKLTDDIRRIEATTLRRDAHRAIAVHCMNETMRWCSERLQTPEEAEKAEVTQ